MNLKNDSRFQHACCVPFFFDGDDHGILLIHGFTGCVSHMRPLGDALRERGYTVMGINLPGHATTEADMAETGWQEWLQAANQATAALKEKCETVMVCGLSMGGLLALLAAGEMEADACVPISTPMATQNKWLCLAGMVAPFYPRVAWPVQAARHESVDAAYDYGYAGFPTRSAAGLHRLIKLARRNLSAVRCPVLCVQSAADRTVWQGSADVIMQNVSSRCKQKLILQDAPHVATLSKELPVIVNAVDDWARKIVEPAGAKK
ncbi:MAG: alpha/beta fold hydrolase [Clostridia bacterium]|nr:alpha/beta fold hydrolase [Clostridia bacterium]